MRPVRVRINKKFDFNNLSADGSEADVFFQGAGVLQVDKVDMSVILTEMAAMATRFGCTIQEVFWSHVDFSAGLVLKTSVNILSGTAGNTQIGVSTRDPKNPGNAPVLGVNLINADATTTVRQAGFAIPGTDLSTTSDLFITQLGSASFHFETYVALEVTLFLGDIAGEHFNPTG